MGCLTEIKIQEYIDENLNTIESSIIRDHLIICEKCKNKYDNYKKVEKHLNNPVYINPPKVIERNVLRRIFPMLPAYSSIFVLIGLGFMLLITGIYIFFDFANNSIIQALQLTSNNTSNWVASIIKIISAFFSSIYAVFKALSTVFETIFNVNVGVEVIAAFVSVLFILLLYPVYRVIFRTLKGQNK